jgi:hypothetical protein
VKVPCRANFLLYKGKVWLAEAACKARIQPPSPAIVQVYKDLDHTVENILTHGCLLKVNVLPILSLWSFRISVLRWYSLVKYCLLLQYWHL